MEEMIVFIDDHRGNYGVEAICRVLPVAPSSYYHHQAVKRDPSQASLRAQRDAVLAAKIKTCWEASGKRYGAVKVWHDLAAEIEGLARCTVVRLMKGAGIQGVTRGKGKKTTHSNPALPCPEDKVNREFNAPAPNILWVADFTYVRTAVGFVYVAFIIDVFARFIVGWQVSSSPNTKLVLDALDQALAARNPDRDRLTHHSDRGVRHEHPEPPDGPKALDRIMQRAAQRKADEKSRDRREVHKPAKPACQPINDLPVFYADWVRSEKYLPPSAISNGMRDQMLARGLVTREQLRERGIQ